MSATKKLSEVLNSAPTATSLSGLSMLLKDSSGGLAQMNAKSLMLHCGMIYNLDQVLPTGFYQCGYPLEGTLPEGQSPGSLTFSMMFCWTPADNYSIQIFARATAPSLFIRNYAQGAFTGWLKFSMLVV